ncbi:MAG: cold shock domain-containing protein [Rhodobacteraceae bacterium]|nr:cold shock domain-containing protein [Paracoccaceae bacterium]
MAQVATCYAKRYRADRGFGFVTMPGGADIFLHRSILDAGGFQPPLLGASVEVEYESTQKGFAATRVISIEGGKPEVALRSGSEVWPARVKFFDWQRGFGFVNIFGAPSRDVHVVTDVLDGFETPPARGEAVAVYLEEDNDQRVSRLVPWERVVDSEGDA